MFKLKVKSATQKMMRIYLINRSGWKKGGKEIECKCIIAS
jgi:hypothetical protein